MPNKTLEKWEEKTIKQLSILICDGDWIESKNQSQSGIRLIQTGNVGNGFYKDKPENSRYISEETFKKLNCTEIFSGDCLVSRLPEPLGRACLIPNKNERMITAVDCSIIRFNDKNIIPKYFIYYSMSNNYHNKIINLSTGATRQRISRKNLETITIPTPNLKEQQRIVKILDEAFENIEKAKQNALQNLNNAKELFESYLNNILKYLENIGEFKQLSTITEVKDGTHDSPKYVKVGIPFITQKNIKEGGFNYITDDTKYITEEDHNKFYQRSNVKKNDILISMIGANRGMACIVDIDEIFSIKNVGLIKDSTNIDKYYLLYYLKSNYAKQYIAEKSKGGAQEFVGLTALRAFPILYVDVNEQQKIVAQLDELQEPTKKLEQIYEQKIKDLDELKQSILQKAFNGEL